MRHLKWLKWASSALTGTIMASLLVAVAYKHVKHEQAVMCLAENIYHEGRGESVGHRYMIGLITLARVLDRDRQWPEKTICGVVAQDKQFSWTLDYRLATNVSEKKRFDESVRIARDLLDGAGTRYLMPKGWECARFYKRKDDLGVSKRGGKFFGTLVPVGTFGSHVAYRAKRGCADPMKTT